jgi:nucleoside-diphosphate-sugar epimerase
LRKECIMRVSVTGAAGFTGSAIVRELPALVDEATLPLAAARVGAYRGIADESGTPAGIAAGLA